MTWPSRPASNRIIHAGVPYQHRTSPGSCGKWPLAQMRHAQPQAPAATGTSALRSSFESHIGLFLLRSGNQGLVQPWSSILWTPRLGYFRSLNCATDAQSLTKIDADCVKIHSHNGRLGLIRRLLAFLFHSWTLQEVSHRWLVDVRIETRHSECAEEGSQA